MNNVKEFLDEAVKLNLKDRALLIEGLVNSIDEPDRIIDEIWIKEAEARLTLQRTGKLKSIPASRIFGEDI